MSKIPEPQEVAELRGMEWCSYCNSWVLFTTRYTFNLGYCIDCESVTTARGYISQGEITQEGRDHQIEWVGRHRVIAKAQEDTP